MPYCKHCRDWVQVQADSHECRKVGLLNINEDDSFLVSTLIGMATDSGITGALLGGSLAGGMLGDFLSVDDDGEEEDSDDSDDSDW